ncbi:hypothetical protein Barb6_00511 [Bacteroidales bacterium Barb6]|nr:hypothetical protein Barb6_00511 [Bacteroidales bacterium Barb6]
MLEKPPPRAPAVLSLLSITLLEAMSPPEIVNKAPALSIPPPKPVPKPLVVVLSFMTVPESSSATAPPVFSMPPPQAVPGLNRLSTALFPVIVPLLIVSFASGPALYIPPPAPAPHPLVAVLSVILVFPEITRVPKFAIPPPRAKELSPVAAILFCITEFPVIVRTALSLYIPPPEASG